MTSVYRPGFSRRTQVLRCAALSSAIEPKSEIPMAPAPPVPLVSQPSTSRWWGLTVVCLGTMMSFLNITQTVSVLGPVAQDLHTSSAQLVWIPSIYPMAVASLVLSSGTLGDLFGRRRIFASGAAILGAGSLVSFFAHS